MDKRQDKKQHIKKWLGDNQVYLLSFGLPVLIWLSAMLVLGYEPFGEFTLLISDGLHQYFPFLSQYRERILEGDSLLYCLSGGMGFDYWELFTYYLSSPLNILLLLSPGEMLGSALNLLVVLKVGLCGLGFALYLGSHGKKHDKKVILYACGYACSSFLIGYRANLMWIEVMALFPVTVSGLEEMLERGRARRYIISLALALWCNFYMGFMVCIFLVLWFFLYEFNSVRSFVKGGLRFAGASLLSAGLAGVILIPAYFGVSGTGTFSFAEFEWIGSFAGTLYGSTDGGGIFPFQKPLTISTDQNQANLYCGMFVLSFLLLYFADRGVRLGKKIRMGLLLILLFISMNVTALNYIWHGFHAQVGIPNRFVFLALFVVLILAYQAHESLGNYRPVMITAVTILWLLLFLLLYHLSEGSIPKTTIVPGAILLVTYAGLQIWQRRSVRDRTLAGAVFACVVVIELASSTGVSLKKTGRMSVNSYYREREHVLAAAHYIKAQDEGIWRTEIYNSRMKNEALAYNLNATGIFSSMVTKEMSLAMARMGYAAYSNQYSLNNGTPITEKLFGIKYMLRLRDDKYRLSTGYEFQQEFGDGAVTLYCDDEVLPLGYMVKEGGGDWNTDSNNDFENQMKILNRMTKREDAVFKREEFPVTKTYGITLEQITDTGYEYVSADPEMDEHIVFEKVMEEDQELYLHEDGYYIERTDIYINGELIASKDLSNHFYHIGNVKKGDVVQAVLRIENGSPTLGTLRMHLYSYDKEALDAAYQELADEVLLVTDGSERGIKGTIETKEDGLFFVTIPYSRDWTLYVDGEETEIEMAGTGFMGANLSKGEHRIELVHRAKNFYLGISVTAVSLLIYSGIGLYMRRKRSRR